jgi:hypothetical protein
LKLFGKLFANTKSMTKNITFILLFLLTLTSVRAQSITNSKEWSDLINNLENENWQKSDSLSLICINKIPKSEMEGVEASLLRYMYIYSEAGLINARIITKSQALSHVKNLTGHSIILPAHPITLKEAFNSIEMVNDKTDSLAITATNIAATEIFCFEYVIMKDKWPIDNFKAEAGKNYRLGGLIKSINVEGNMLPRFRLILEDGTYKKFE